MFLPVQFVLLDTSGPMHEAWEKAFATLSDDLRSHFTFLTNWLDQLQPPHDKFDCIVSPANSYGIMDGRFDYYLSDALRPEGADLLLLTKTVQAVLNDRWMGYAPPGTCTLVSLPAEFDGNKFDCSHIAVVPTMRVPENVRWDKDLVYNCMWSLLVALAQQLRESSPAEGDASDNQGASRKSGSLPIRTVLVTGLGTGSGRISAETCASQMAVAVKHFSEAMEPEKWTPRTWVHIAGVREEIDNTREKAGGRGEIYSARVLTASAHGFLRGLARILKLPFWR